MSEISKRMTWEEIREQHANQWVVLVEQEWHADHAELHSARVLTSGASRAEAMKRAYPAVRRFAGYGCRYTGAPRPRRAADGPPRSDPAPRAPPGDDEGRPRHAPAGARWPR